MPELLEIVCDKCGFDKYEYDSAWKEYSCKKCGWIVEDAEKISAIERIMGKGLKREKGLSKEPSGHLVKPKMAQSPIESYPYTNSFTVSSSNDDVAWISHWDAGQIKISVLSPPKQTPHLNLDFAAPRKPSGYIAILRPALFVSDCRLLIALPLSKSLVRLVLLDTKSGRELATEEVPNFAFYTPIVNNAGDTIAAQKDSENLLIISIVGETMSARTVRTDRTYGPKPFFAPDGQLYALHYQTFFRIDNDQAVQLFHTSEARSVAFDMAGKVYFGGGFYDRSGEANLQVVDVRSSESFKIPWGREPIDVIEPVGEGKLLLGNIVDERNAFQYSKSHVSLLRVSDQKRLWGIDLKDLAPHNSPILLSVPEEGWALLQSGRQLIRVSLDNGEILEQFPKEKPEFIQAQWLSSHRILCVSRNRGKDAPGKLDIYKCD